MGHLSSMFSGLARSLLFKKGKNNGGDSGARGAAEAMAKEAKKNDMILRSSGIVNVDGSNNFASVFSKRGEKGVNQDCCIVWEEFGCQEDMMFCGIFDGHGPWGHFVAKQIRETMPPSLLCSWQETLGQTSIGPDSDLESDKKHHRFNIWKDSYIKTCAAIDHELEQHRRIDSFYSGTTALSIVRQGELIFIANVGDSRAVLATTLDDGSLMPVQLTVDSSSMLTLSKFPISSSRNRFTAVGCDTLGVIVGSEGRNYTAGCASFCTKIEDVENGTCSGIGCCQMPIPRDVIDYTTGTMILMSNHSYVRDFNPCSYAFVVEKDAFNFSSLDLGNFKNRESVPVVVDWAVGNQTCQQAKTSATYACLANNSECYESNNGGGYICKCNKGYQENPYLLDGCQDINECEVSNPCSSTATCNNILGSVNCLCPKGHDGDGMTNGEACSPIDKRSTQSLKLAIALGICIGTLALLVGGFWIYWGTKRRKYIQLREKFFQQNGGMLLQQQLSCHRGSVETAKIFTAEELQNATNNYDESRVLGQGGYGTVYRGLLSDNKVVAIKKSKICDQSQIEQFINEVIVLSQVNHRNVVKLLGCCLETEVPLLVYEFITNGTLSDHLHDNSQNYSLLPWEMRLKIAAEAAGALAYLHSATSMPIIHRDVKTTNILLDDNYIAKVADFGASRLIPIDQTQLTTLVQGTLGYLDPEYFHSSQLTEKSDVYSFGVVLAELLTGKKALSFDRPESERNLAMYFVSSMKEDRLIEILDDHVNVDEEIIIKQIREVASLTKRCLKVKGDDRPTMKEVTAELDGLISLGKHPWGRDGFGFEETEYLLNPNSERYNGDGDEPGGNCSTSNTSYAGFDSMKNHIIMPHDDGR